jgi:phosphate starvation-inducible PhoH-like protein
MKKNKLTDFDETANVAKKSKIKKIYSSSYLPKTENQQKYVDCLNNDKNKMIIVSGPAGTGKTMFACLKAIDLLNKSDIDKIIITRPIITVEEEIGFLPGNIVKKMDPWTKPIFDLFMEYYSKMELDNMINKNIIEISPLGFMRGRTFKNAFIIADEMQNSSPSQMKMLTTRLGTNTRMVITGDLEQTDYTNNNNNNNNNNGLFELVNKIKLYYHDNFSEMSNKKMIELVTLERKDVERSEIVRRMIDIYSYKPVEKPIEKEMVKQKNINNFNDAALIPIQHMKSNNLKKLK